jgi:peroxiredoxin
MKYYYIFSLCLFVFYPSWSQYKNNDSIANFTLTDVNNNIPFELNKVKKDFVVLLFIGNDCPFVDLYIDRIKKLQSTYPAVSFVLINSYSDKYETQNIKNMNLFLEKNKLNTPYLKDQDKDIAHLFNVRKIPEAHLLARINNTYKLTYKGTIDDNPQSEIDIKIEHLKNAIETTTNNKNRSNSETHSIGCRIH